MGSKRTKTFSGQETSKYTHTFAGTSFVARYDDVCIHCESAISRGDLIRKRGKRVAHDWCCASIVENRVVEAKEVEVEKPKPRKRAPRVETWIDLMGRKQTRIVE